MKNWMQRLALLAAIGAILSSSALVGCGDSGDEGGEAGATPAAGGAAAGED